MKRDKNEELKQTLTRIGLNINNFLTKKINKKNKNKQSDQTPIDSVVAQLLIDGKSVNEESKNLEVWKHGIDWR